MFTSLRIGTKVKKIKHFISCKEKNINVKNLLGVQEKMKKY